MRKHMATGKTICRLEMYTWQLFHHTVGKTKTILQQCMRRGKWDAPSKSFHSNSKVVTAQFGALHFKTGMTTWSKLMGRIVKIDHSFGRHDLTGKKWTNWAYCLEKTDKNLWAAATSERGGNSLFFMLRGFKCWNCTKNPKVRCNEK